jgi:hypothetical protein
MLLEQKPTDYGMDRYIWTGKIISQVIQQRWGITSKERCGQLSFRLGLDNGSI